MGRSGLPDYGMYAALENMGNLVDYGELAARLGSMVTYNREGYIVFWDDFEKTPLKWETLLAGGNGFIGYSDEYAYFGGQSLKLQTHNQNSHYVYAQRYFPIVGLNKVGMQFILKHNTSVCQVRFDYKQILEGKVYYCRLYLNFNENKIKVLNSGGTYTTIEDDFNPHIGGYLGNHFKIVFDNETQEYVRFLYNREEYNIEDIPVYNENLAIDDCCLCHFTLTAKENTAQTIYIDNFILTQNEP
jgi:hypothetical protein